MSLLRTDTKPKLDTGLKAGKPSKKAPAQKEPINHEATSGPDAVMKVRITTKPRLDTGTSSGVSKPKSEPKSKVALAPRITIADLCEEDKTKVYNIIEQLVTLTNDHENILTQLTLEKQQYDADINAMNERFTQHLLPIEEVMKQKDEAIFALEEKNSLVLAMIGLYQGKLQNLTDISHFQASTETDLHAKITLLKSEVEQLKLMNGSLQHRIETNDAMAAVNASAAEAAAKKTHEAALKQLELRLEGEKKSHTTALTRNLELTAQVTQLQIELDRTLLAVSAADQARAIAESAATEWRQHSETQREAAARQPRPKRTEAPAPTPVISAVLANPYRADGSFAVDHHPLPSRRASTGSSSAAGVAALRVSRDDSVLSVGSKTSKGTKRSTTAASSTSAAAAAATHQIIEVTRHTAAPRVDDSFEEAAAAAKAARRRRSAPPSSGVAPIPSHHHQSVTVTTSLSSSTEDPLRFVTSAPQDTTYLTSSSFHLPQQQQQQPILTKKASTKKVLKRRQSSASNVSTSLRSSRDDLDLSGEEEGLEALEVRVNGKKKTSSRVVSSRLVPPAAHNNSSSSTLPFDFVGGGGGAGGRGQTINSLFEKNNKKAAAAAAAGASNGKAPRSGVKSGSMVNESMGVGGGSGGIDYDVRLFDVLGDI